jgi:hypothetical protein
MCSDILSRLTSGFKDIAISIHRYYHTTQTKRCFEQLFALLTWNEEFCCYVGSTKFNYRRIQCNSHDVFATYNNTMLMEWSRIRTTLSARIYLSGEAYAKRLNLNTQIRLPKSYIFTSGCNAVEKYKEK